MTALWVCAIHYQVREILEHTLLRSSIPCRKGTRFSRGVASFIAGQIARCPCLKTHTVRLIVDQSGQMVFRELHHVNMARFWYKGTKCQTGRGAISGLAVIGIPIKASNKMERNAATLASITGSRMIELSSVDHSRCHHDVLVRNRWKSDPKVHHSNGSQWSDSKIKIYVCQSDSS